MTADGGYMLAGNAFTSVGQWDGWLVKLNSSGDLEWQKLYGGPRYDGFRGIMATGDGGYVIAGETAAGPSGHTDGWLLKVSSSGVVLWQKRYGGDGYEWFRGISAAVDGGYFLAGSTDSFGSGRNDGWVVHVDSDGGVLWQRTYGGSGSEFLQAVSSTAEGGCVAVGSAPSFDSKGVGGWFLKLDFSGSIVWQRIYGGSPDGLLCVTTSNTNTYVAAGSISSTEQPGMRLGWLLAVDSSGNSLWERSFKGIGEGILVDAQETRDGGYIAAGWTNTLIYEGLALKVDLQGHTLWQNIFNGGYDDSLSGIMETSDNGYVVVGATSSSFLKVEAWALSINSAGLIDPSCGNLVSPCKTASRAITSNATPSHSRSLLSGAAVSKGTAGVRDASFAKKLICKSRCTLDCTADVPSSTLTGSIVTFSASAKTSGGCGTPSFRWDFGDGATSTKRKPRHAYPRKGNYTWHLTVSTASGEACPRTGILSVSDGAIARSADEPTSGKKGDPLAFTARATSVER